MNELKYKIREDLTKKVGWHTVYRIEALKDFSDVKKGDLGGFVEKEDNLSQEGECWVYDDACVYENARVYGDAQIYAYAKIYESAEIYQDALISGNAQVFGMAEIYGHASIYGHVLISGSVDICGYAKVHDKAVIDGCAKIWGHAEVYGYAKVSDYAKVGNYANIYGYAHIIGSAIICDDKDYYVCKCIWSHPKGCISTHLTYTHSNKMWCYKGDNYTGKELVKKMSEESESDGRYCESMVDYIETLYKNIEENNNTNK